MDYAIATETGWRDFRTKSIIPVDTPPPNPSEGVVGWELTTANTGLAKHGIDGDSLTLYTGPSKPLAGATIRDMRIIGMLDLSNGGIILERCLIRPASVAQGLPVITTIGYEQDQTPAALPNIIDCTIEGTALPSDQARGFTIGIYGLANIKGCQIHSFGSGVATIGGNASSSAVVEDNYIHTLISYGDGATTGNHCDAYTIRNFQDNSNPNRTLQVKNNRFDCSTANATGAFFMQTIVNDIDNVHVEGNYLEGAGYNLVLETHSGNTYSKITAHNNRFRPTSYGPGYTSGGPGWQSFTDGYIYSASNPDNRGQQVFL